MTSDLVTQLEGTVVHHGYAQLESVRLHYVEAGSGPLVLLLHGFPEFWYGWRRQIPALVNAGFRVVAPDLRGYNLSDKPRGVDAYRMRPLVNDVAGLIRACGAKRAHLVGHDWGAVVAWAFAMRRPELLDRLVVLNGPHPASFLRELRHLRQLRKSWYMFFFQLPWLPEALARKRRFAMLMYPFRRDPKRPGTFDERDRERYAAAFDQPGALTSMINYYRAMFRRKGSGRLRSISRKIERPVLVVWGDGDRYLGRVLAQPDPRLVPNATVEYLSGVSHWVHHERPDEVNALMVDFLRRL